MTINVLHRTSVYRGDHSADVLVAVEFDPRETIEGIAERLTLLPEDVIEIRAAKEWPGIKESIEDAIDKAKSTQ